jgi:hypothetical protein
VQSTGAREKSALHTFGDTARQAINAVFEKAD